MKNDLVLMHCLRSQYPTLREAARASLAVAAPTDLVLNLRKTLPAVTCQSNAKALRGALSCPWPNLRRTAEDILLSAFGAAKTQSDLAGLLSVSIPTVSTLIREPAIAPLVPEIFQPKRSDAVPSGLVEYVGIWETTVPPWGEWIVAMTPQGARWVRADPRTGKFYDAMRRRVKHFRAWIPAERLGADYGREKSVDRGTPRV